MGGGEQTQKQEGIKYWDGGLMQHDMFAWLSSRIIMLECIFKKQMSVRTQQCMPVQSYTKVHII